MAIIGNISNFQTNPNAEKVTPCRFWKRVGRSSGKLWECPPQPIFKDCEALALHCVLFHEHLTRQRKQPLHGNSGWGWPNSRRTLPAHRRPRTWFGSSAPDLPDTNVKRGTGGASRSNCKICEVKHQRKTLDCMRNGCWSTWSSSMLGMAMAEARYFGWSLSFRPIPRSFGFRAASARRTARSFEE